MSLAAQVMAAGRAKGREHPHWRPYRIAGNALAIPLAYLRLPADVVTFIGAGVGLWGLGLVVTGDSLWIAVALLHLWCALDGTDGTLARLRGPGRWGWYLDGALHHFLVQMLIIPAFSVGAWLATDNLVFLGLAGLYMIRSHYSTWHRWMLMDHASRQHTTAQGARQQGQVRPAKAAWWKSIGHVHDHVGLTWTATAAVAASPLLPNSPWFPGALGLMAWWSLGLLAMTTVSIARDFH